MTRATWAVYGRGSYFAGYPDPSDIDVVVVTDERLTPVEALQRLGNVLSDAPRSLPVDVHVVHPDELGTAERAVIGQG